MIDGVIEAIFIVVGVLFTAGAFLALYRIVRGPTILDRDVLLINKDAGGPVLLHAQVILRRHRQPDPPAGQH